MGDQQDHESIRQNVNPPVINDAAHGRNDADDDINHDDQGARVHGAQLGNGRELIAPVLNLVSIIMSTEFRS